MIVFCEECGARNDLSSLNPNEHHHSFECTECCEMLMVSKPSVGCGGMNAYAKMASACAETATVDRPTSILIVDDSNLLRKIIKEMFAGDDQLQVVGEAENGLEALEQIPHLKPDVVTLDVNMPVMDGITAIKHIMIKCPTPVVMFSTLTGQGSVETFEALRYGAVDFLQKPSSLLQEDLKSQHELIISRVKNAARAGIEITRYLRPTAVSKLQSTNNGEACSRVFAIGSSYGCYGALLGLIPELQPNLPAAFLSVLHAAPPHVDAFAQYLDKHSSVMVRRAVDGQTVNSGTCYLASALEAVALGNGSDGLSLQVNTDATIDPEKASDRLMTSLSEALKERAAAILLSGIGDDGVAGVGKIIENGGPVIVQDPKTCLCSDTTQLAVQRYGLSTAAPRMAMAEMIREQCQVT